MADALDSLRVGLEYCAGKLMKLERPFNASINVGASLANYWLIISAATVESVLYLFDDR